MRSYYSEFLEQQLYTKARLVPITDFHSDDIFIVGYPKSGNTWMQNLVAGLVYGVDPGYAPDSLIQDLVPGVHHRAYYKRYISPMFFNSHNLPVREYKRVIYLIRDGRDVMVSYFHYNRALRGTEVNFLKMVKEGEGLFPCKWHEHVEAWINNPYNAEMLLIKYEDLKKDPVNELERLCKFTGIIRDKALLNRVAAGTSFERMRLKEVQYGIDDPRLPKDKFFTRRGEIGSYKDEMPQDVLESFLSEAGRTLRKLGYL
jgi:hypothetical protein